MPPKPDLLAEVLATREVARIRALEALGTRQVAIAADDASSTANAAAHAAADAYFDSIKTKPPKPPRR